MTLLWTLVGCEPSRIPWARLGAVLGAAGSLGVTAPYLLEAAVVPQQLSRLECHFPLLTQMTTPACLLCPLSGGFRRAIPQKLSLFFLLHNSQLISCCFKTRSGGGGRQERQGWMGEQKESWGLRGESRGCKEKKSQGKGLQGKCRMKKKKKKSRGRRASWRGGRGVCDKEQRTLRPKVRKKETKR